MASTSFRLVKKFFANSLFWVHKYVSDRTGLTVTIADVGGPLVCGFFSTEAKDDDGLPHTLEHLVFMGSRNYPYKGILDILANRCLASGTNAWTEQNHTCYTLSTAGSRGFLILLPLYLDHILFPMITSSQFITEVHHVTGSGEDGGVVYCEMQEHEGNMSEMTYRMLQQKFFDEGCGYRYETGGRLSNLRDSTSLQHVREYHQKFYLPENIDVIISGTISHQKIFEALQPVEDEIVKNDLQNKIFERPWSVSSLPPLEASFTGRILCPSENETHGIVRIAFRGPDLQNFHNSVALEILLMYLSDSPVSPLQREFVQVPSPFCSKVKCKLLPAQLFTFKEVFVTKLDLIEPHFLDVIRNLATGTEPLDMQRMNSIVVRTISRSFCCVNEYFNSFLFFFETRLNYMDILSKLRDRPPVFWLTLLKEYLFEQPYVIGEPCLSLVRQNCEGEVRRIRKRMMRLGVEGLERCGLALENAIEENEKAVPPDDLLMRCVVNSLDDIKFFTVVSSTNTSPELDVIAKLPLNHLPFSVFFDDCQTNFVYVNTVFLNAKSDHNARFEDTYPVSWPTIIHMRLFRCRAAIHLQTEPTFVKPVSVLGRSGILALGSCESAFLYHTSVIDIDYHSTDLPSLEVLIQYLCQTEGPLWKAVRGHGLAYGAEICLTVETKTMQLILHRSSQPAEAFERALLLVSEVANGSHKIDVESFEAAKRSLILEKVNLEAVVNDAVLQSLLSHFRDVPPDFNRFVFF
ncbi:unnamed protein product [Soboliphyme baturini]|uniref:Presequence protease, mitochondrial n=1 Tax=Soboliphyme baturini TaxID=241478 RepID=A0A183IEZ7_9BILA|nr:unnamed protein product [Soboliphyme baturini]